MSRRAVKWRQLERYLQRHGYRIKAKGGEVIILPPENSEGPCRPVRIGHTSCSSPGAQVLDAYLSKLQRTFGITRDQILDD